MKHLLLLISVFSIVNIYGQSVITLAEYRANYNPASGSSGVGASSLVSASGITRGGVLAASGSGYAASSWTTSSTYNSGEWFEVSIAPKAGYKISLTHILFNFLRDANGPHSVQLRTSADGYANALVIDGTQGTTNNGIGMDLSDYSNLQNLTGTVYLRFYGYQASSSSGIYYASAYTGYSPVYLPTGETAGVVLEGKVATAP